MRRHCLMSSTGRQDPKTGVEIHMLSISKLGLCMTKALKKPGGIYSTTKKRRPSAGIPVRKGLMK